MKTLHNSSLKIGQREETVKKKGTGNEDDVSWKEEECKNGSNACGFICFPAERKEETGAM